uniref:Transmembrane protein n=1 Tax=Glossina brevipalpis TaxID=37001 RepID=A0A1A9WYP9_9MUSC
MNSKSFNTLTIYLSVCITVPILVVAVTAVAVVAVAVVAVLVVVIVVVVVGGDTNSMGSNSSRREYCSQLVLKLTLSANLSPLLTSKATIGSIQVPIRFPKNIAIVYRSLRGSSMTEIRIGFYTQKI